jgi:hypothetical protein
MIERKDVYGVGERYPNNHISKLGVAVIRPAVFQDGKRAKVITSAPCCPQAARSLDFADLTSKLAESGWSERCKDCGWHYLIKLEHTGNDPRLGLYGVRWISQGF